MKRKRQPTEWDRQARATAQHLRDMPLAREIGRTDGATIGERPELALRDQGSRIDADGQGRGA